MAAFRPLFRLNLNGTGLGWQTFGVFELPKHLPAP
jgi:hypothetical protein